MFLTLPETKLVPLEEIPTLLSRGWCIPCLPKQYEQFEDEDDRSQTNESLENDGD